MTNVKRLNGQQLLHVCSSFVLISLFLYLFPFLTYIFLLSLLSWYIFFHIFHEQESERRGERDRLSSEWNVQE